MVKHFQIFTFLHLFAYSLFALPANDIDKDPWLRSWLFVGPFEDYESAIKLSDSLSNSSFQEIEEFVTADPSLVSHKVSSSASNGTHSAYQYFPESNEKYIIGFCNIYTKKNHSVYYNQVIHDWDEITFFIDEKNIVERSRISYNWEKVSIKEGNSKCRLVTEINPRGINHFSGYYNNFKVGLFNDNFVTKIDGKVVLDGNPLKDAQVRIKNDKILDFSVATNDQGFYEGLFINEKGHENIQIISSFDDFKFFTALGQISPGLNRTINIQLEKYASKISGRVTTLYKQESQPNIIINLIDKDTKSVVAQAYSDNSGYYSFDWPKKGNYLIKIDTKDGEYYATNDAGEKKVISIGNTLNDYENIDIKCSLINRGSWKRTEMIDGLRSNYINDIMTDSKNRVWYSCHTGISVYDGKDQKQITAKDGLADAAVNMVFEDSKGIIYSASRHSYNGGGGLYTIDEDGKVTNFLEKNNIQQHGIETVAEDSEGNIIFSGWMGLYVFDGTSVAHYKYGDGIASGQIMDILIDKNNTWLATTDGLVHFTGSEFINHEIKSFNSFIRKVFKSPNGELYVSPATWGDRFGLHKYDGFQFEPVQITRFNSNIRDLIFDDNDGFFFNSWDKLIHFNGNIYQSHSPMWSTNNNMTWILALEKSYDGTIKIGTWESGVWDYDMESISVISDVDGIKSWINHIKVDNDNYLWASTGGDGLYKIKDSQIIKTFNTSTGFPTNNVRDLEIDSFGNLWATSPMGLISIAGSSVEVYDENDGFISNDMWNVEIDNNNTIWVAGEGFLSSMNNKIVRNYQRTNDTARFHGYNAGLLPLPSGDVLHGGLDLKILKSNKNGHTLSEVITTNTWINGIETNSKGDIYYSDVVNGIIKYENGKKILTYNNDNGFLFNEPTGILIDNKDWIWTASGSAGVAFFDGTVWNYLNSDDGLLNNNVSNIAYDTNGNYYFAHRIGITRYRPKERKGLVSIKSVSTSKSDYLGSDLEEIESLISERIRITYNSQNTNFRPGIDKFIYEIKSNNWSKSGVTVDPFIEWYPSNTGEYQFSVKSVDRDLNYSNPKILSISILNPWYIRTTFLIPFLGFLSVILYTTYYGMSKFIKQKEFNEKLRLNAQQRDKEARLKLEEKNKDLVESQKAAEAANEAKSTFLANMSHELRTPLNAIIGYSEMLIEDAEDENEDFIPDLDKINSSGKHLLGLINDILDLSKVESGKMELFIEEFDLEKVLNEVVSTITPLVEKNNNTLNLSINTDTKSISADITKIRQILLNLLSNATKFTNEGEIGITVVDNPGNQSLIDFQISDSGIGMTSEQVDKVFKPFTQADEKTTRKFGGTGLGLTITKMFSEMMGGGITLSSVINEGTTFTVTIPKIVIDPKKLKEVAEENTPTTTEGSFTILVIDDDPNAQELMKKFLLKENYMVLQATSGHDGLDLAAKHLPDLITLDVMMPEMDGWEVLAALQNNETTKNIPVIMLTLANEPDIGYSLGATDYLTKPVDWGRLSRILEKHEIETSSQSILIVEDDEITREMLKKSLETNEYKVSVAKNGKEGLERVKRAKPALILLDLMMPEMDGFEFAEELRENKEWLDIPVVVITAKDLNSEDHNRLKGNVEAIMQKGSYTKDELLSEVGYRIKKLKERV